MDHVDRILEHWHQERADLDVAPMGRFGRMKRLNQCLLQHMRKTWAEHGLNAASFDMLAALRRAGPPYALSPGDLMASTMVISGTMTHRVDQLEKARLVTRVRNPNDGCSFLVSLSDKGFEIIDAAVTDHVAAQARLAAHLSLDERTHLDDLLRTLLKALEG
ncbi:MarR family transcriptional regulator [Aliiroseovarius sediminis]|uniref:MarR family winged helix-turn-helix transcriptional regulator n=1 Tax=Aliiroseovarius sediminis TaxID=2925839 RepID=UPI001F583A79|nr:MarR family transcriptional regulator [Aliiroseovarius sediminis]MCI2394843.1 MarR family transcriptional regulator [Aliiroseovarius sediminis]